MMDFLNFLGVVASIGAAIWAWRQAVIASRSASAAEKVKAEIIERSLTVELSQVQSRTSHISKAIAKIGPACTERSVRGIDCQATAQELQEYVSFLREHAALFDSPEGNRAGEFCDRLAPIIEMIARAKTFDEKKEAGKVANYLIDGFLPRVKLLVDHKRQLD